MKLGPAQLGGFLKSPPTDIAIVLLHGPDEGLVRERAAAIVQAILGSADDPFRYAQLSGDDIRQDPARLADEATSLSLIGGRRVIRLRDVGEAAAKTIDYVLSLNTGDTMIVVEAEGLDSRSKLRSLCEASARAAVIGCYADGPREIGQLIRETLAAQRITITEDAVTYLLGHLGNDRMITRQELEKLSLLAGAGGKIDLDAAVASVGDTSALDLDDVIYNAMEGKRAEMAAALDRLLAEGMNTVTIIRAALRHAQRLHIAAAAIAGGETADIVIRNMRPPLFFKLADRFRAQLRLWPLPRLERVLLLLSKAERDCKTTGFPDDTICRQTFLSISRLPQSKR